MNKIILIVLFSVMSAKAEVFKCVQDRHVTYSSTPCKGMVTYNSELLNIYESSNTSISILRSKEGFSLPGTINDFTTTFLIDTGASHTTISGDTAQRLGIKNCHNAGYTETANGRAPTCRLKITSLKIGSFTFSNIEINLNPTMRGDLTLLGNDLLSTFKISQESGVMTLSK